MNFDDPEIHKRRKLREDTQSKNEDKAVQISKKLFINNLAHQKDFVVMYNRCKEFFHSEAGQIYNISDDVTQYIAMYGTGIIKTCDKCNQGPEIEQSITARAYENRGNCKDKEISFCSEWSCDNFICKDCEKKHKSVKCITPSAHTFGRTNKLIFCSQHLYTKCDGCGGGVCKDCMTRRAICDYCGKSQCDSCYHVESCDSCGTIVCEDCGIECKGKLRLGKECDAMYCDECRDDVGCVNMGCSKY